MEISVSSNNLIYPNSGGQVRVSPATIQNIKKISEKLEDADRVQKVGEKLGTDVDQKLEDFIEILEGSYFNLPEFINERNIYFQEPNIEFDHKIPIEPDTTYNPYIRNKMSGPHIHNGLFFNVKVTI